MAELVFFSCSPDLSGEPCLFLSMQPLGAAIFLVHLLETLSCFLITYFLFFGFGLNICVRHTVLLGCFRSEHHQTVGLSVGLWTFRSDYD